MGGFRRLFLISTEPLATEASSIRNTKTALPSAKGGFVCYRHSLKPLEPWTAVTEHALVAQPKMIEQSGDRGSRVITNLS